MGTQLLIDTAKKLFADDKGRLDIDEVADLTVKCLWRTVPRK